MDIRRLARGLGWFSIALGLAELAAPGRVAQAAGIHGRSRLLQLFGLRELASGLGILGRRNTGNWLWSRVAGDMMDLGVLGAAARKGFRDPASTAFWAVLGVTALDVFCSRRAAGQRQASEERWHVRERVTIERSPEELYSFWHDFQRLPDIMNHLESVRTTGPGRSHWVAKGPLGVHVSWDAEVSEDLPNRRIAWQSLPGSEVESSGAVRFEPAGGGRGTVVEVNLDYRPPAGAWGATLAKLFGEAPEKQIAVDLRRFKQLMETGETATTSGQPAGRARSTSRKYDDFIQT